MHESVAYKNNVKPKLRSLGVVDCGDWPQAVLDERRSLGQSVCCFDETPIEVT